MTSFYGGGCLGGGGGSGSDNYNDLLNTPIKNLTGSSVSPLVLSNLGYGVYNFQGSFKPTPDGSIVTIDQPIQITVVQDRVTHDKVIKYESFENGKYYVNTLTIKDGSGGVVEDKIMVGGEQSSVVTEVSSMVKLFTF